VWHRMFHERTVLMVKMPFLIIAAILICVPACSYAQGSSDQTQQDHSMEDVNRHGDTAMGFSHLKTTHHFVLSTSGGSIEVKANDANDTDSRDHIRMHLQHVAMAFKDGDFSAPEITHSRVPPGVPTMKRLKADIQYKYEGTPAGGRVVISTRNPQALQAVHEFLAFQIDDHQTGDPKTVQK
jgi:hypothetical protein